MLYLSKFLGKIGAGSNPAFNSQFPANVAQLAEGVLTAAQIKALHTTPIALVAAPGTGKYISVDEIVLTLNYGAAQFTGANAVEFRYTDGSGNKVTGDAASAWLDGAANAGVKVVGAAVTPIANAAVVAVVPSADPAVGDSTVSYSVKYRVVTLP